MTQERDGAASNHAYMVQMWGSCDRARMAEVDRAEAAEARAGAAPAFVAPTAAERAAVIAATADGYPFPTNLDTDPPLGGLAPETQQALVARAVEAGWDQATLDAALETQTSKRRA